MSFRLSKFGDWTKAGEILQVLSTQLQPLYRAQLDEDGEMVLKKLQGHIQSQDLGWAPLKEQTVRIKGGATVYVESGWLSNNLECRKVKAPANGYTLFIGASAWKTHPSGVKFSDLMIYLEYGTHSIVPRPLIRPTAEEVEDLIKNNWRELLGNLIKGGVK